VPPAISVHDEWGDPEAAVSLEENGVGLDRPRVDLVDGALSE